MHIREGFTPPHDQVIVGVCNRGCPTRTGKDWLVQDMDAAIEVKPHIYALDPEVLEQPQLKIAEREMKGRIRVLLVLWEDVKGNLSEALKIS